MRAFVDRLEKEEEEALKGRFAGQKEKREVEEALRRYWEEGGEEFEENLALQEATEALENAEFFLDRGEVEKSVDALLPAQRMKWEAMLRDGSLAVQAWEPWWETDEDDQMACQKFITRDGVRRAAWNASPIVRNNVVEVLCSFCHIARRYNGDLMQKDATEDLLHLSQVLSSDARHTSVESAIRASFQSTGSLISIEDASVVIQRKCGAYRALHDAYQVLSRGKSSKYARLAAKKVQFLIAWVDQQPYTIFLQLAKQTAHEAEEINSITASNPPNTNLLRII